MATVVKSFKRKREVFPYSWKPGDPVDPVTVKEVDQYITVVKGEDNHYYFISSVFTSDNSYETMVFECNSTGEPINWQDLYCEQYETEDKMISGHKHVVDRIDDIVRMDI